MSVTSVGHVFVLREIRTNCHDNVSVNNNM